MRVRGANPTPPLKGASNPQPVLRHAGVVVKALCLTTVLQMQRTPFGTITEFRNDN
jgi:hypothetical protein